MIFVVVVGLQGESEGRACRPPGALWTRDHASGFLRGRGKEPSQYRYVHRTSRGSRASVRPDPICDRSVATRVRPECRARARQPVRARTRTRGEDTAQYPGAAEVRSCRKRRRRQRPALARVYACVLDDVAGPRLVNSDTVAAFAQQQVFGTCLVTRQFTGFGIVFERPGPDHAYGSYQALGHRGANGSLGFCDPMFGVAFGFVRQPGIIGGFAPEAMSLAATVRACATQAAAWRA